MTTEISWTFETNNGTGPKILHRVNSDGSRSIMTDRDLDDLLRESKKELENELDKSERLQIHCAVCESRLLVYCPKCAEVLSKPYPGTL